MAVLNIVSILSDQYYQLTASERKVCDYVLGHQRETQYMSITELAEACGVAEATISRFCRRLELKGYNAFKLALAESTTEPDSSRLETSGAVCAEDSVPEMCQKLYNSDVSALAQTLELINPAAITKAAKLLAEAQRVYCMGQGGSMILAEEAAHLFSTVSPRFCAVQDSHMQAITTALLTERDVLLFFSYSGSTKELIDVIQTAQGTGVKIILVTRFPKSPGTAHADVVLQCGDNEGPLQAGSVPARMAQLFLIDVLFSEMCRQTAENVEENREKVALALSERHL